MLTLLGAQLVAMLGLGGGSFLLGICPLWFNRGSLQRWPLLTSAALCFGAGVLLATALVHMLPELRVQLSYLAEPVLCAGFFLLYFVDEMVHFLWTASVDTRQCIEEASRRSPLSHSHTSDTHSVLAHSHTHYGSTDKREQFLRPTTIAPCHPDATDSHCHADATATHCHTDAAAALLDSHCHTDATASLLCHTTYKEPCPNSATGRVGLLVALTVHSLLEGLAIGLQNTATKVMLLVAAVACHKLVVALCLGVELASSAIGNCRHVTQIAVFAVGSAGGIGIGMGVIQTQDSWTSFSIPILQAVAAGTLLYVTVCEVLPRERARWHHQTLHRSAGIVQFLSVAVGFCLILTLNILFVDSQLESPAINGSN